MNEAEQLLQALRAVYLKRVALPSGLEHAVELPDGILPEMLDRLVREGLVNPSSGNSHYHLTYEGMCEYTRLKYREIMGMLEGYYKIRQQLRGRFAELADHQVRRIALFGTGMIAEAAHGALSGMPLQLVAVVTDHRNAVNFYQFKLEPPEILSRIEVDRILLCSYQPVSAFSERLNQLGIPRSASWHFRIDARVESSINRGAPAEPLVLVALSGSGGTPTDAAAPS